MKNFIEKHPFWFGLGFMVIVEQILGIVIFIVGARILGFPELPVKVFDVLVIAAVSLYFIWRIGWWEDSGFVSTTKNAYALTVPLILAFFALVLKGTIAIEPQRVNFLLLAMLFTGVGEEAIFRGLFVRAFLPRGKWQALLIPAVLFGAAHFTQSIGGQMTLQDNLVQIGDTLTFALLYGAVRLRINNIWPLIILHMLEDVFFATSGLLDGVYVMSDIPLLFLLIKEVSSVVVAIYLMRKPIAATINGVPVGTMDKPLATSSVESQPAD